jgi:hypothetical protein
VALGDKENAARAEIVLADVAWWQYRGDAFTAHAKAAGDLARDLPASRAKAMVLGLASGLALDGGEPELALDDPPTQVVNG